MFLVWAFVDLFFFVFKGFICIFFSKNRGFKLGEKYLGTPHFYWCAHEKKLSNVSAKNHAFCDNCDNCDKNFLCSAF